MASPEASEASLSTSSGGGPHEAPATTQLTSSGFPPPSVLPQTLHHRSPLAVATQTEETGQGSQDPNAIPGQASGPPSMNFGPSPPFPGLLPHTYGIHPTPPPPFASGYPPYNYSSTASYGVDHRYDGNGPRRKQVRASQACDACRQRKQKCDEARPECGCCQLNSLKCSYRDIPPQKQDKQTLAMTEKLDAMHFSIQQLLDLMPMLAIQVNDPQVNRGIWKEFGPQDRIPLTLQQQKDLESLEESLLKLHSSPNWNAISKRVIGFITSLTGDGGSVLNGVPTAGRQPSPDDLRFMPDHSPGGGKLARMSSMESIGSEAIGSAVASEGGVKRKRAEDTPVKQHFCFHESCAQCYKSGKSLENHIRSHHKDRWPELPGSCNHDGNIKIFRTWDDSLFHLIHHQKLLGMSRSDYDTILAAATFLIDHSNRRVYPEVPPSQQAPVFPSTTNELGDFVSVGINFPGQDTQSSIWMNGSEKQGKAKMGVGVNVLEDDTTVGMEWV